MNEYLARYLYRPAAVLGGLILMAVTLLTVLDVVLRHALSAPVAGAFELTELAMVGIVFLALGEAQHQQQQITIDLVYERLPSVGRRALDILALAMSVSLTLLVTWQLIIYLERARSSGEVTGVLGLSVYPAVGVAAFGVGLFSLAVLGDLVTALGVGPRLREVSSHDA
jgi:TRAP-type C4-dicarboxylate transport system permease small subunit